MKVFAIQTSTKITPQFKQTNSVNQTPIMKTNLSRDKFVSNKVSFGATYNELVAEIARLQKRLDTEKLTDAARKAINDSIDTLKVKKETLYAHIEDSGEHYCGPAAHGADHPFD